MKPNEINSNSWTYAMLKALEQCQLRLKLARSRELTRLAGKVLAICLVAPCAVVLAFDLIAGN